MLFPDAHAAIQAAIQAAMAAVSPPIDLHALLDDELKAALSDLGDLLGDVFGGVNQMSGRSAAPASCCRSCRKWSSW